MQQSGHTLVRRCEPRRLASRVAERRWPHLFIVAVLVMWLALSTAYAGGAQAQTNSDVGYRDFSYNNASVNSPTAEKPQNKLWFNNGLWWGDLFNVATARYEIYRLDWTSQTWSTTGTPIDTRGNTHADCLWDGAHLYVASAGPPGTNSADSGRVFRFTYDSASKLYTIDAGFPVTVSPHGMEAIVLAKDSLGKLWITYTDANSTGGRDVYASHTLTDDLTWTAPFVLPVSGASNLSSDDISAIIAYSSKIGIMWSNQVDSSMYFASHLDGSSDSQWTAVRIVSGPGYPDDHMNIKQLTSDSSGQVFAVVKTSLNDGPSPDPNAPLILLLVMRPTGAWSVNVFGTVADDHTRPIVLIDEEHRELYVFATTSIGGGTINSGLALTAIYYKETSLDNISFPAGKGLPFIQTAADTHINNASSTRDNLNGATGLVVIASDNNNKYYLHNVFSLGAATATPTTPWTPTGIATATGTVTQAAIPTSTATATATATAAASSTASSTPTNTATNTPPGTPTASFTPTNTWTNTPTDTPTLTNSPTSTPSSTATATPVRPTVTATATATVTATATAAQVDSQFSPAADTYIDSSAPNKNYGHNGTLYVNSSGPTGQTQESWLRFDVAGVSGVVTRARLRVFAYSGSVQGPALYGTGTNWSETGLTWANRLAKTTGELSRVGAVGDNTWVEYDVTAQVTANGSFGFALVPTSTDGLLFYSRNNPCCAKPAPQLVITWRP